MKKILLIILSLLVFTSCSNSNNESTIPSSTPESSVEVPNIPTSDPNDVGGDNLQSDWDW